MANPNRRNPHNAPGPWFVDDTCMDCDASRQCAPELFGEHEGRSVILRQPRTSEEITQATRALLLCPTGSIGTTGMKLDTRGQFPLEIEDGVCLCGFNSPRSFGASSYFVKRPAGNFLIDSPRLLRRLVKAFEEQGGIQDIFLTHRDDVADASRYARHFGARVWIHEDDRRAAPFATNILKGLEPARIREGLQAIPVPGHTRGSVVFHLEERFLFSGDSLYWSRTLDDLCAFRWVCWYSWEEHTRSLERLLDIDFCWVLPGHGNRRHASAQAMRAALQGLIGRMKHHDPRIEPPTRKIVW